MAKVKQKYLAVLAHYVLWAPEGEIFLRPTRIPFDAEAPSAAEWMKAWESEGVRSKATSEPDLLQRYQQGKINRDWHISEWKEGVRMRLFLAEEFIGTLGLTEENFESIFGRPVDPATQARLHSMEAC